MAFNIHSIIKKISLLLLIVIISDVSSQLSKNDISYIKSTINALKDEKTGVFSTSNDKLNLIAVESLKLVNEEVSRKNFCRELDFSKEEPSHSKIILNTILSCDIKFELSEKIRNSPYEVFESINSIIDFYEYLEVLLNLKITLDEKFVYDKLSEYKSKLLLFSLKKESEIPSINATTYGIKILARLFNYSNTKNNNDNDASEFNNQIKQELKLYTTEILNFFQILGDNEMGVFTENNINIFVLNTNVLEAFEILKEIIEINSLDKTYYYILDFYLKFKHNINDLEQIHSLLKGFKILSTFPIIELTKNTLFLDDNEEKAMPFRIVDLFGNEDSSYKIDFKYKKELKQDKDNYSLDSDDLDDEDDSPNKEGQDFKLTVNNVSSGKLSLSDISELGSYSYSLEAICTKNDSKGTLRTINKKFNFRVIPKIKIDYLKVSASNTVDSGDAKESKVDFPKRSFRSIKATQNSVITVKVKVRNHNKLYIYLFFNTNLS